MIPESIDTEILEIEEISYPSLTYGIDFLNKRINKWIDGKESIMQAIIKILNTERYAYVIYSDRYGVELDRLIGQEFDFIKADIERTIKEALFVDDRILSITNFEIEKTAIDKMRISFIVTTVDNELYISEEVGI